MTDEKSLRTPTVRLELTFGSMCRSPRVALFRSRAGCRPSGPGPSSLRSGARAPFLPAPFVHSPRAPVRPTPSPVVVFKRCILRRLFRWRGGRVGRRQPPAKRLQGQKLCPGFESLPLRHGPLAQVDRASGYEPEGQRFESSRAHHSHARRGLDAGGAGRGSTRQASDEVPIGAVVVIDGAIVGARAQRADRARTIPLPTPRCWRCERRREKVGNYRLPGATLYVTVGAVRDVLRRRAERPDRRGSCTARPIRRPAPSTRCIGCSTTRGSITASRRWAACWRRRAPPCCAGSLTGVDVNDSRRGGRARLKASDSKSDRGPEGPSGVQILSPPPTFVCSDVQEG